MEIEFSIFAAIKIIKTNTEHCLKTKLHILNSKGFIFCLTILLLNDFCFKYYFHNWLTGKLSDFSGLYVFSFFFAALFPRRRSFVFILTALLFIIWKSEFSTSFINIFNNLHLIKIGRVVDYTDYLALVILPIAYFYVGNLKVNKYKEFPIFILLFISLFAMTATSYRKSFSYDKIYYFTFGKQQLINRINKIKNDCGTQASLSLNIKNADSMLVRNDDTAWVHISGYSHYEDTIFNYKGQEKVGIDTIYHITNPIIDTIYITDITTFERLIPVRKYITKSKTGYCDCLPFRMMIKGDGNSCYLVLKTVSISNCMGMFESTEQKVEQMELLNAFEKEFIDLIK